MTTTQFNATFKHLSGETGKHYLEDTLQYCGYWFMQLTERQHDKVVDLLKTMGYEIKHNDYNNTKWIYLPNGLGLKVNK